MVTTRSVSKKNNTEKKNISSVQKPKPPPKNEEKIDEDNIFDDELYENEYPIPNYFNSNQKLKKLHQKIVDRIEKDNPTLENIIRSKIRLKRKKEMLEWFYIYKYSFPNSEDRVMLKIDLNERLDRYKREYVDFQQNKDLFMQLESSEKSMNSIDTIRKQLFSKKLDDYNRVILFRKFYELQSREYHDEEYYKLFYWMKSALELPFLYTKPIEYDEIGKLLYDFREKLDKELYGMKPIKEQIMLYIHNKIRFPTSNSQPLGLLGPPGVGKTSIALLISRILNIPFHQICLGGVSHGDFLKGHDSTYVGSKPGAIATALMKLNSRSGIILLDEFEKVSENKDVVNSLLHITDLTQNHQFQDNFFGEIHIDLSTIWYICSMNEKPMDKALQDRIFYIDVPGYSFQDKIQIVKNYLLPKSLKNFELPESVISFQEEDISYFIRTCSENEQGIRLLKQGIQTMISKIVFLHNCDCVSNVSFDLPSRYKPVHYPFRIDRTVIDCLLKDFKKKIPSAIMNLYI